MLDRLAGRRAAAAARASIRAARPVAREADVHLALRVGTNLALMNALIHEIVRAGLGRRGLRRRAHPRLRGAAARRRAVHAASGRRRSATFRRATSARRPRSSARASGCSRRCCRASTSPIRRRRPRARSTTSTCCAACSAGPAPACCQMNGQPTAQNTRETGADGDLPGFRNWDNHDAHRRAGRAVERRRA